MAAPAQIHNGHAGWRPLAASGRHPRRACGRSGAHRISVKPASGRHDAARSWLRGAMAALAFLAAGAAVVSWDAQYVMVQQVKRVPVVAALEAGIPDAGALIFASLGIALALHGRRALRPRALNVGCVARGARGEADVMTDHTRAPGWGIPLLKVLTGVLLFALALPFYLDDKPPDTPGSYPSAWL